MVHIPWLEPDAIFDEGIENGGRGNSIALSADGSVGVIGYSDGLVSVVETASGARRDFEQHVRGKAIRQVAISLDGKLAASASCDGTLRIFATDTLYQESVLGPTPGYDWASGVAMSGDGSVIIGAFSSGSNNGSDRGKLVRYDWMARRETDLWAGFSKVFEVVSDVLGEKIAFIKQGGHIVLLHAVPSIDVVPVCLNEFSYMKGDLDMAIDAIGAHLLIADNELLLHKVRSNVAAEISDYKPSHSIRRVALTADGSRCVETSKKKSALIVRSLSPEHDLDIVLAYLHLPHKFRVVSIAISPNGSAVMAADDHGQLLHWKLQAPRFKVTSTNLQEIHPRYADTQLSDIPSCLVDNPCIERRRLSLSPVSINSARDHLENNISTPAAEETTKLPSSGLYSQIKLSL